MDGEVQSFIIFDSIVLSFLQMYIFIGDDFEQGSLLLQLWNLAIPTGIYLLKFSNRNIRTRCEICSKLTLLLTLNIFHTLF